MGKQLEKPNVGLGYTDEQIKTGLELAAVIGQRPAAKELGVSTTTLRKWRDRFPRLWSDLRAGEVEAHRAGVAARLEDLADEYVAVEQKAIDRAEAIFDTTGENAPDAKETAALIKAMSSGRAQAVIGARTTRGEPDSTVNLNVNFPDLERAMDAILGKDRTATESKLLNEPSTLSTAIEE